MADVFDSLRGGLIVSVQAWPGSAIDDPATIAALAACAENNGAAAVRVQGWANIRAVRKRVHLPLIGLVKRTYPGFEPYITPTAREVDEVVDGGAQIVAFDATQRDRPGSETVASVVAHIRTRGAEPLADCAQAADGSRALALGTRALATTLCGYTAETKGEALPALGLLLALIALDAFAICEGGVTSPEDARKALAAGASAVVVGSAITNVDWLVARFVAALKADPQAPGRRQPRSN